MYIPRTQMASIFEGQPLKTRPFPIKTRVIWVLGIYIYIHIYIYVGRFFTENPAAEPLHKQYGFFITAHISHVNQTLT